VDGQTTPEISDGRGVKHLFPNRACQGQILDQYWGMIVHRDEQESGSVWRLHQSLHYQMLKIILLATYFFNGGLCEDQALGFDLDVEKPG